MSLNKILYSMFYILYSVSWILCPVFYILYFISCIVYPLLCSLCSISYILYSISCIMYPVPCILYLVSCILYSGNKHWKAMCALPLSPLPCLSTNEQLYMTIILRDIMFSLSTDTGTMELNVHGMEPETPNPNHLSYHKVVYSSV